MRKPKVPVSGLMIGRDEHEHGSSDPLVDERDAQLHREGPLDVLDAVRPVYRVARVAEHELADLARLVLCRNTIIVRSAICDAQGERRRTSTAHGLDRLGRTKKGLEEVLGVGRVILAAIGEGEPGRHRDGSVLAEEGTGGEMELIRT